MKRTPLWLYHPISFLKPLIPFLFFFSSSCLDFIDFLYRTEQPPAFRVFHPHPIYTAHRNQQLSHSNDLLFSITIICCCYRFLRRPFFFLILFPSRLSVLLVVYDAIAFFLYTRRHFLSPFCLVEKERKTMERVVVKDFSLSSTNLRVSTLNSQAGTKTKKKGYPVVSK